MTPRETAILEGCRVLIVDDEPGYREMMHWMFESHGVHADVAGDGHDGIAMAAAGDYALIVTDVTMPRASGLDLLKAVKASTPRTVVVIATGFGTVETAVHAMKNGAADFLLKPFDTQRLDEFIQEYLLGVLGGRSAAGKEEAS